MRVLVCGGRDFGHSKEQRDFIYRTLNKFAEENSKEFIPDDNWLPMDLLIITGKAKGVDTVANDWAIVHYAQWIEFPADWKTNGRAAGPIRNQQMIAEGKPDIVLAFPGGDGTRDMTERARAQGIKVIEFKYP